MYGDGEGIHYFGVYRVFGGGSCRELVDAAELGLSALLRGRTSGN